MSFHPRNLTSGKDFEITQHMEVVRNGCRICAVPGEEGVVLTPEEVNIFAKKIVLGQTGEDAFSKIATESVKRVEFGNASLLTAVVGDKKAVRIAVPEGSPSFAVITHDGDKVRMEVGTAKKPAKLERKTSQTGSAPVILDERKTSLALNVSGEPVTELHFLTDDEKNVSITIEWRR